MSGVFLCLIQNWEAAARRNFLLDRKDKQAGPMRLFIVFSPTGKTSKQILQVTAM
tara:strand:+ start:317 stop:481 length:165 start_codon:yes stop_codon:yes gene_type:complete